MRTLVISILPTVSAEQMHSPDRRDWRSNLGCLDAQERVYKKTDLTGTSFGQTGRRVPEEPPLARNDSARAWTARLLTSITRTSAFAWPVVAFLLSLGSNSARPESPE